MEPDANRSGPLGLYLSIPFCRSKCTFCNFASGVFPASDLPRYVAQLIRDIRSAHACAREHKLTVPAEVDTLYLGGGTPSILSANQLREVFSAIRGQFTLAPTAEITIEAAPALLDEEFLEAAAEQGVNRISFGVQTFVDAEAKAIGRLHTAEQALADLDRARRAGIRGVSLDLIAGLPGQTDASWRHSLATLTEAAPDHASIYMLEVDEDSRLGGEMLLGGTRYGAALTPSDDAVADFYVEACSTLAARGLVQYEISNFARAGHASRHNLRYWQRRPYLGLGLDAHSMLRTPDGHAVRFGTTADLGEYLAHQPMPARAPCPQPSPRSTWGNLHRLDRREELEEAWFLGLRRNAGVQLEALEAEFGSAALEPYAPILDALAGDGLIVSVDAHADPAHPSTRIQLTGRGRLLSNEVFAALLGVTPFASAGDLPTPESSPLAASAL